MEHAATSGTSRRIPYLETKLLIACGIFTLLTIATAASAVMRHGISFEVIVFPLLATVFAVYTWRSGLRPLKTLDRINDALVASTRGELHHRVVNTVGLGEVGKVAWQLNDFLDFVETYFKEVSTCFTRVGRGEFHRLAEEGGLPGRLSGSLGDVNRAIGAMGDNVRHINRNRIQSQLHVTNSQNLLSNLKRVQDSLSHVSEEMGTVQEIARRNVGAARQSRSTVDTISHSLTAVAGKTATVVDTVGALQSESKQVSEALRMIRDVADQTSLLALNASIEAARAGEHGRGFAVVADEVKALSERTKQATVEISDNIERFNSRVSEVMSESDSARDLTSEVAGSVEDFRARFDEFADSAETTIGKLTYATDTTFGILVKLDHMIFKQNGYVALDKGAESAEAAAAATDHRNCRLGKWYYEGQGLDEFSHTGGYRRLEGPHAEVHSVIHEALERARTDWESNPDLAEELVACMERAERASDRVIDHIDEMVQQRHDAA